jgi:hypothetical protein
MRGREAGFGFGDDIRVVEDRMEHLAFENKMNASPSKIRPDLSYSKTLLQTKHLRRIDIDVEMYDTQVSTPGGEVIRFYIHQCTRIALLRQTFH